MSDCSFRRLANIGASILAVNLMMASFGFLANPAEAAPQRTGATGTSERTLPTVTIGKAVNTIPFTVVDVAQAEGFFKRNGVAVKEVLLQGSSAANAAMVGGSLQFTCEAANPLMLARLHGVPIISIDALDTSVGLQMVVSNKWLKKHPIAANAPFKKKMADLNGSVFGSVSTTDQTFYRLLRGWAGLPEGAGYKSEQLGSQAAIALGMERGIVDVTIQSPPVSVEITQQGYGKNFVDRRDVKRFDNVAYDILTTTSSYAQKHPRITTDVATAIAQALDFMRKHPKQVLLIEQKHFPKLSKAVLQQSVEFIPFAKDGMQSQAGWSRAVKLAQQTGFIKNVKSAPEGIYWTNKYIDLSRLHH
jgi:NitT/TauT family transport system substrate-binding protein